VQYQGHAGGLTHKEAIMGAQPFITEAHGTDARKAFHKAVDDALYDFGHNGYTGTIAEKSTFVILPLPKNSKPYREANRMIDEDDQRISDKWGPAGAFELKPGRYLFFGWASY
jgi:hypothetical protein